MGAGAAGISLARRLRNTGLGVVLLESGGHQLDLETQALYAGKLEGTLYYQLDQTRLRYFGGTTNHWTGWCRPMEAIDLSAREWVPYSGWPLTMEELFPYYEQAQLVCELGDFNYSPEYWATQTRQPLLPLDEDLGRTAVWQFSPPTRFGPRYADDLDAALDIDCYLHANLVDIETDRTGRRVERIRFATLAGKEHFVYPEVLILALGAIENARMLLAADGGRGGGVGNRHGIVGRFFMEHPHSPVGALLAAFGPADLELYDDVFNLPDKKPPAIRAALSVPEHVQEERHILGFSLALEPRVDWPPLGRQLTQGVARLMTDLQRIDAPNVYQLYARTEQTPNPRSRIYLDRRRDRLGVRKPILDWQLDDLTHESIKRGMEVVAAALGRARLGRVYSFPHADDQFRAGCWPEVAGGHHHMGTTRMGDDPAHSVVNRDCRVHDVENLYVAGSSVFPTSGFGNPTLTIVALALRLADHVKGIVT